MITYHFTNGIRFVKKLSCQLEVLFIFGTKNLSSLNFCIFFWSKNVFRIFWHELAQSTLDNVNLKKIFFSSICPLLLFECFSDLYDTHMLSWKFILSDLFGNLCAVIYHAFFSLDYSKKQEFMITTRRKKKPLWAISNRSRSISFLWRVFFQLNKVFKKFFEEKTFNDILWLLCKISAFCVSFSSHAQYKLPDKGTHLKKKCFKEIFAGSKKIYVI